jgi:hypothetical protein
MNYSEIYKKTFKLKEFEASLLLKFLYFSVLLSFFVTFYGWISSDAVTIKNFQDGLNICPPYFQNCGHFYFLQYLPYGYTQGYFYVFLFLLLGYGGLSAYKNNWVHAHAAMLTAFVWKVIWIFFLTYGIAGNYDYYDLVLSFVLLFLTNKEYFAKLTFVWFYFLASTIKIDEGWIFGNYFEALITGAPIFPDFLVPYFTNIVICMQIVGAWFLLSNNKLLQKIAFLYFFIFHIYSGFIVNYRYITISITALVILFGQLDIFPKNRFEILKISKKTLAGYGFLVFLLCGQFIGIFTPGNQKKTLEGNYYGLYMFEAAHQCVSTISVDKILADGTTKTYAFRKQNHIANNRCDPYQYWYEIKRKCELEGDIQKVSWTFDHSINGHPYERIVDVDNACGLKYKSFGHNDWIKLDGQSEILPSVVYKTGYLEFLNEEKHGEVAQPRDNPQLLNLLKYFYSTLWLITLLFVVFKLFSKK